MEDFAFAADFFLVVKRFFRDTRYFLHVDVVMVFKQISQRIQFLRRTMSEKTVPEKDNV